MPPFIALTISRQVASGGEPIGRLLAQRLGYSFLDRAILRDMAGHLQRDPAGPGAGGRPRGFWGGLLGMFALSGQPTTTGGTPPLAAYDSDRHLLESQGAMLREMAGRRDLVVVGRAGFALLADHPGLISVFLMAPRQRRAQALRQALNLASQEEALAVLEACDAQRGQFVQSLCGRPWSEAGNYHLCLDTGRLSYPEAAEIIAQLVEKTRQALAAGPETR